MFRAYLIGAALLTALAPTLAHAKPPDCLVSFAVFAGPPGTLEPAVVTETYLALLREVGKTDVTPEVMDRILAAGDPLVIPADVILTTGLDRQLRTFREMVLGHSGEAGLEKLKPVLLGALRERRGGAEVARKAVEKAVLRNDELHRTIHEFAFSRGGQLFGPWLTTDSTKVVAKGKKQRFDVTLHFNGPRGEVREAPLVTSVKIADSVYRFKGVLGKDGDIWVAAQTGKSALLHGKFLDEHGDPLPEVKLSAVRGLNRPADGSLFHLELAPDGRHLLYQVVGDVNIVPIVGPGKIGKSVPFGDHDYGGNFVGGEHLLLSDKTGNQLVSLKTAGSTAVEAPDGGWWGKTYDIVGPSPDGTRIYAHQRDAELNEGREFWELDPVSGRWKESAFSLPQVKTGNAFYHPSDVVTVPGSANLVAIVNGASKERTLFVQEVGTGKVLGKLTFPTTGTVSALKVSEDGQRVVATESTPDGPNRRHVFYLEAIIGNGVP